MKAHGVASVGKRLHSATHELECGDGDDNHQGETGDREAVGLGIGQCGRDFGRNLANAVPIVAVAAAKPETILPATFFSMVLLLKFAGEAKVKPVEEPLRRFFPRRGKAIFC